MVTFGLKLTVSPFTATVVYHSTTWRMEGPPHEWFQLWITVLPELTDVIDYKRWWILYEGHFSSLGAAGGSILLPRADYEGQMVRCQAIGENDVFSNAVDLGPLLPKKDEPQEVPKEKFICVYCKKQYDTLGELSDHIKVCSEYLKQTQQTQAELSKVTEALSYDQYLGGATRTLGTTPDEVAMRAGKERLTAIRPELLGTGETPGAVYTSAAIKAQEIYDNWLKHLAMCEAMETVPFVDTGSILMQMLNSPKWGAGNQMARNYYFSGYENVVDHMLRRYYFEKHTPLLPEAYRLALATSKGLLTDAKYKEAMAQSGLKAEWADMWLKQNYEYPNIGQITSLYWRKVVTDETYEPLMRLAGYRKEDIVNLKELTKVIPPLTDLITMAVREAFGEHTYEEQMPALLEWGAKMGLSAEWVERYWYSHWDRIPVAQMYINLYRGYWDRDAFDRMLRIKDVHPDDRQAIFDAAYTPPTVRELGYGYDTGDFTREDVKKALQWAGRHPDWLDKCTDAMINYRTSAEWEAIRREFLWRFAHEQDTEEEYRTFLKWTGLQDDFIELWVNRGYLQQERYRVPDTAIEYRVPTSSEALWAFKNNLKDEAWLRKALYDLNWNDNRIQLAVERALYEKAMAEDIPDIITPRTLTIAQLKSLYQAQLISIEALTERLVLDLHYTLEDAEMLAETFLKPPVEPKPAPEPRKLTLSILKQMYEAQVINKAQLIVELVESLNYDINDAYAIAELYTPPVEPEVVVPEEKVIYTKPYSDAWSRRLYAQRLLMDTQVYNNYIALGYEPKQAEKLTISMLIDDLYPMLTAQYSKGLIGEYDFLQELVNVGMEPWQAVELLERTIRDFQVDRLDDERKLTKAEIIKGYKTNILTPSQTVDLLTDIGYEYWEAEYIIILEQVIAAGDPESYWDMKKVTEAYKKALNRGGKAIPEEVLMLDKEIRKIKQEMEEMTELGATEPEMAKKRVELGDVEARLRKVLVLKKLT